MDLNKPAPVAEAPPAPAVRVMRLPRTESNTASSGAAVFSGGEALPESQGFDTPHPISPEEREALIQAGYSSADIDEIAANHSQLLEAMLEELPTPPDDEFDGIDNQIVGVGLVDKGFTNEPPAPEPEYTRHVCIVTPCTWYLDVPPVDDDVMSLLGGVSPKQLEQAQEVEDLMFGHLAEHTVYEWARALKQAQGNAPIMQGPPRITAGYAEPGITPGPAQRDPARAAAVAAVDARLGRSAAKPATPADAAAHDEMLRARRKAAREQAKIPTAYELTPRWSSELGDGVVGIKR